MQFSNEITFFVQEQNTIFNNFSHNFKKKTAHFLFLCLNAKFGYNFMKL